MRVTTKDANTLDEMRESKEHPTRAAQASKSPRNRRYGGGGASKLINADLNSAQLSTFMNRIIQAVN